MSQYIEPRGSPTRTELSMTLDLDAIQKQAEWAKDSARANSATAALGKTIESLVAEVRRLNSVIKEAAEAFDHSEMYFDGKRFLTGPERARQVIHASIRSEKESDRI